VSRWATASLDAIPPRGPGERWIPLRRDLGVSAFGVNAWTGAAPDAVVIHEHDEAARGHEELYVVLSGRARFALGGEELDAPAGTVVHVGPETTRSAVAAEAGTVVLAVGAPRGRAFAPSAWEDDAETFPLFAAGEYDRARDLLRDAVVRHPGHATMRYNLACAEARLGDVDEARAHLARAVELNPELAETARTDPDLESVR
jgi:quercetin dioxygenase-like cupin family protein